MRGLVFGLVAVLPFPLLVAGVATFAVGRRKLGLGLAGAGTGIVATAFAVAFVSG